MREDRVVEVVARRYEAERGAGVDDFDAFEFDFVDADDFLCDFLSRRPPVPSSSESENSSSRWIRVSRSATVDWVSQSKKTKSRIELTRSSIIWISLILVHIIILIHSSPRNSYTSPTKSESIHLEIEIPTNLAFEHSAHSQYAADAQRLAP